MSADQGPISHDDDRRPEDEPGPEAASKTSRRKLAFWGFLLSAPAAEVGLLLLLSRGNPSVDFKISYLSHTAWLEEACLIALFFGGYLGASKLLDALNDEPAMVREVLIRVAGPLVGLGLMLVVVVVVFRFLRLLAGTASRRMESARKAASWYIQVGGACGGRNMTVIKRKDNFPLPIPGETQHWVESLAYRLAQALVSEVGPDEGLQKAIEALHPYQEARAKRLARKIAGELTAKKKSVQTSEVPSSPPEGTKWLRPGVVLRR